MPIVSVIIPTFNAVGTLNATLESVLGQTYQDWEAIIVDDGSADFTASNTAVWRHREPRFNFLRRKHQGAGAARNEGVVNARSPWLIFLDANDLISPDQLAWLVAATVAQPEAGLIYCASATIAADGRIGACEMPPAGRYFERLATQNIFSQHSCLVRRELFESVGGFDPALPACEDWDLWQRLARAGVNFVPAGGGVALYRVRTQGLSHRAEMLFQGAREVIARGHGKDPRVSAPAPAYANGEPAEKAPHAVMSFALWCGGLLIGAGSDPSEFLLKAPLSQIDDADIDRAVSAMQGSVPAAAGGLQEDWPALWPRFRRAIYGAYSIVEQRCSMTNFAGRCMDELEGRLHALWDLPAVTLQADDLTAQTDTPPPAVGHVSFGDLWRLDPIGAERGLDRGDPIDRFYIESFLERHSEDVRGRVLEAGGNIYTKRFGGDRVVHSDVLHINRECKEATIIADLATADHIPSDTFDCIILPHTLHLVFDLNAAVRNLERILKPGGTVLLTVPGINQVDSSGKDWYWSMTAYSVRRLLKERFPQESVAAESRGNVLSAIASLQGLPRHAIGSLATQTDDEYFPVTVMARATKAITKWAKPPARSAAGKPNRVTASLRRDNVADASSVV